MVLRQSDQGIFSRSVTTGAMGISMRHVLLIIVALTSSVALSAEPRFVVKKWLPPKKLQVKDKEEDAGQVIKPSEQIAVPQPPIPQEHIEVQQTLETQLDREGVVWNTEFFKQPQATPKTIHFYSPKQQDIDSYKEAVGEGDDQVRFVYHNSTVQGAKRYPALWNSADMVFYYRDEVDSLNALKEKMGIQSNIVGAFTAATITRQLLDSKVPWDLIKQIDGIDLKNKREILIPIGGFHLVFPPNFQAAWVDTDETKKFTFPGQLPMIRGSVPVIGSINQKITSISYSPSEIYLDLPRMIDATIQISNGSEASPQEKDTPVFQPEDISFPEESLSNQQAPASPQRKAVYRTETRRLCNGRQCWYENVPVFDHWEEAPLESKPAASSGAAEPTPLPEVTRVINLLPRPEVGFVDFGCGEDARWCVAAANKWQCKVTGIELDPRRARAARKRVKSLGLDHLVTIVEGDALTTDVEADVAVMYLYPETLVKLRPRLRKFRAVASYMHEVPGVQMQRSGDTWIYQGSTSLTPQVSTRPAAVWGGMQYSGPLCNNPRCAMCNEIRRQLGM